MKTVELKGIIEKSYSDKWHRIKLRQEDDYKIDLVSRFKEAIESYPNMGVQVSYYLSNEFCTKNEMINGFLKKLFGVTDASYEANDYCYSEWTMGIEYDTNLRIGGHDLFKELQTKEGKFIFIEINFIEMNKITDK